MQAVSSVTLQNRRKEGSWAWEHKTQKCSGDLGVLLAPCTAWESRSWDVVGCWVVAAHQSYRNSGDFKGGALLQAASWIRISSWCNLKDSCKGFFLPNLELAGVMPSGAIRGCLPLAEPAMILLIIRSPFRGKIPSNQKAFAFFFFTSMGHGLEDMSQFSAVCNGLFSPASCL